MSVMAIVVALTASSTLTAVAQSPGPGSTPLPTGVFIDPLDPRAGSDANTSGAPLLALLTVLGIGVATAVLTAVYIRVVRAR